MIQLLPIEKDIDIGSLRAYEKSVVMDTLNFYQVIGFEKPWISYMAWENNEPVGICSFKGRPVENCVEIAYHTFPEHESNGFATAMCCELIKIAKDRNMSLNIIAHTLPEKNASTSVLEKNNFKYKKTVIDPDDGEIFRWVYMGM